ncbi:ABC-type Fe3+/spermidine/putrescine transport system ATPase subunit [Mucilaginibacter gracilis]|uniref:ABC-type Fe3+/spermidine/putrescine transport system ATPase subunit n=1 Tax=Mucilaginibacter gracilis TaxID=423350 RepID=A0A495J9E9_9SPHI|nr:ABC transporter ATP-binding protein [Mucilaginibacter gracilis]RKR85024.1 ABC-type Fe3+/spermidine/putrescine transport system ATPase subunit [Mucilaginibacter gracilis]
MDKGSFLQAISVTKNYSEDRSSGVNNVILSFKPGKITAIVGESGSGKSTLLKLLYGLLDPDEGQVLFKGEQILGPVEKLIPGHDKMKMVTQHTDDLNLFATAWENVSALLSNINLEYKRSATETALKQLRIFELKDQRVAHMSGGEKQRVAIARALISKPEILFLDEPFNQVDASFREGLQQTIRQIVKDTGLTVIMVSHDPAEVLSMADELIVLKDGETVEHGTPAQMYARPKMLYTAQLLSHCSVLNKDEALVCGITATRRNVAITPENVEIDVTNLGKRKWKVTQVLFKGFYEEILIEKDGTRLRALNIQRGKYREGSMIDIKILKYFEYGQWE